VRNECVASNNKRGTAKLAFARKVHHLVTSPEGGNVSHVFRHLSCPMQGVQHSHCTKKTVRGLGEKRWGSTAWIPLKSGLIRCDTAHVGALLQGYDGIAASVEGAARQKSEGSTACRGVV
jgi:hypothetical protein